MCYKFGLNVSVSRNKKKRTLGCIHNKSNFSALCKIYQGQLCVKTRYIYASKTIKLFYFYALSKNCRHLFTLRSLLETILYLSLSCTPKVKLINISGLFTVRLILNSANLFIFYAHFTTKGSKKILVLRLVQSHPKRGMFANKYDEIKLDFKLFLLVSSAWHTELMNKHK